MGRCFKMLETRVLQLGFPQISPDFLKTELENLTFFTAFFLARISSIGNHDRLCRNFFKFSFQRLGNALDFS